MQVIGALLKPWSMRSATIATLLCGVLLCALLDRSEPMRDATWHIDEGQRIAESYFFRLLEERAFDHPDWFREITDSSHPQMSKYFFGLALRLQGTELPRDLALPRYYESGGLRKTGWRPPEHLMSVYEPMLRPSRRAALLCNVVSWMVVTWFLLRWCGVGAACLSALLFTRHYLPVTLFAHARSDALQTCAFTLTILPLAAIWRATTARRAVGAALLVGLFSAIAFQTRLNGLLALGGAGVVLIFVAARHRNRRAIVLLIIATITCATVAVLSNPYYWGEPAPAPGLSPIYSDAQPLPLRIVSRFRTQVEDLGLLLHEHSYAAVSFPVERSRFVATVLFSGVSGFILLAGIIAAGALLLNRNLRRDLLFPALWSFSVLIAFALWLPLNWEPYVLLIFPTAVLLAASGWHAIAVLAVGKRSRLK